MSYFILINTKIGELLAKTLFLQPLK